MMPAMNKLTNRLTMVKQYQQCKNKTNKPNKQTKTAWQRRHQNSSLGTKRRTSSLSLLNVFPLMITVRKHQTTASAIESPGYTPYKAAMAKNNNNDTVELDDAEDPILSNLNCLKGVANNTLDAFGIKNDNELPALQESNPISNIDEEHDTHK